MTDYNFKADLLQRIKQNKPTRWVRFALVSIIFFVWVAWLENWWVSLWWLLLFDIYITGFIPFTWWKKSKDAATRTMMSWVDAIVYALVLVYFIFAFVGQNYQIPSSSLEKTLLTGDYLWVNKMIYGPRVPMTPVNFPLVHNRMPMVNCDSYLDHPSLPYHRLKGWRNVELGDIVVFNFPAGDTVLTRLEDSPEYYYLVRDRYGRDYIEQHPEIFGKIKYRPVDRRQNFVKRAVGLPGQRLKIVNDTIYLDGKAMKVPEHVQFAYVVTALKSIDDDIMKELSITPSDVMPQNLTGEQRTYLAMAMPSAATAPYIYTLPLTSEMITTLTERGYIAEHCKAKDIFEPVTGKQAFLFPTGVSDDWTLSDYGGNDGLLIPAKGTTIKLNPTSWAIYNRCIRNYEGHTDAYLGDDNYVYIDGRRADSYTFAMNYYFMMGDNRDFSQDSRFWGFVPEDHVVGSPMIVLISFDRDRSIFNGGIRWNRILHTANPDK
jgi:signal peptidase I